jgi:hypothetical protein
MVGPGLGYLAVPDVEDVDDVDFQLAAGPFGAGRGEYDDMVIVADHVVQFEPVCPSGQLRGLAEFLGRQ